MSAEGHGLHVFGTLLAAVGRQRVPGRPRPTPDDVRLAVREGREGNLVIFVVDASGSMAARDRMSAVSGAALSLLRDAYQRRDKVAVITFRQEDARLLLPPTSSVHIAGRRLAGFDTGGKTPLAQGLLAARDLVVREKARDRARRSLVVVLTDGRATGGPDPSDVRGRRPRGWWPRGQRRSWWTAKHLMCDWVWLSSWPAIWVRLRCAWHSCGPTTSPTWCAPPPERGPIRS